MNGRHLTLALIALATAVALGTVVLTEAESADATITGDMPPPMGDWVINNPTTVVDENIMIWDGNITVNSRLTVWGSRITIVPMMFWDEFDLKVTNSGSLQTNDTTWDSWWYFDCFFGGSVDIDRCDFFFTWTFNTTGTVTIDDSWFYYAPDGCRFMGRTDIENSTFYYQNAMEFSHDVDINGSLFRYQSGGFYIDDDRVDITNSRFERLSNRGFFLDDCDATLDNVTIQVSGGTQAEDITTDRQWPEESPMMMGMGTGLWVVGGKPTLRDLDVEADNEARWNVEYTGKEADVEIFVRAMGAPVVIETDELSAVTGFTVHDSRFNMRCVFSASDPGRNPLYYEGVFEAISAGLGVVNYDDVAISGVSVSSVQYNSIYRSISGGYYSNQGWTNYGPRFQIVAAIGKEHSTAPDAKVTLMDMSAVDGKRLFGHFFAPDYTGTGTPVFKDTVLIQNVSVTFTPSWESIFYLDIGSAYDGRRDMMIDVDITMCHFTNVHGPIVEYSASPGPGLVLNQMVVDVDEDVAFHNNTIDDCSYDWAYVQFWGVWENMMGSAWDRVFTIADNRYTNSEGSFFSVDGIGRFVKGKEELHVINNVMHNLSDMYGWNGPFYVWEVQTVMFKDNDMKDMAYGETADMYDDGGDANGIKPVDWRFVSNTVDNCTNDRYYEIIYLEFGGEVRVIGNEIMNCEGLLSIMHTAEWTGQNKLVIDGNDYHDNMQYIVEYGWNDWVGEDQMFFTLEVKNNDFHQNEDYLVNYWGSSSDLDAYDYDGLIRVHNNTFHNNTGGCVHAWGDVRIVDNNFFDNQGPLALVDHINLHIPDLSGNMLANNHDLYELVAKDRGFQLLPMSMGDLALTCSGTALSFTNMQVELTRVDIPQAGKAIVARNSVVDAMTSQIDGDSCQVVGDGMITTWWPMEVKVTWGDKMGTDSGKATEEALIVFYDADGAYYTSAYANMMGMLPEDDYRQWSVDLGGVHWYSPYTVKAAKAGATNDEQVDLDRELTGADIVHIVLWDTYEPVVAITEPFEGEVFAQDHITALGFVTEVGSGLEAVEYSTDGGDTWDPMVTTLGGDWTKPLSGLADGEVTILVRASDVAGNQNTTSVTVTIDTTPPELTVTYTADITNVSQILITGTIEAGAELFINGVSYGMAPSRTLEQDYTLHEGRNVITVEAFDAARNSAMVVFEVVLDTLSPILVVTGPADDMVTREDSVMVTGVVEVGSTLSVGGTQVNPDDDGAFSYEYFLEEGENDIIISAIDDAGNAVSTYLMVFQDKVAPDLSIISPLNGTGVSTKTIQVRIEADEDAMLWLNGRPLPESGMVNRTVLLLEGENVITVVAEDAAGNIATESVTVILDTRPPSLDLESPLAMVLWTKEDKVWLRGHAMDADQVYIDTPANPAEFNADTGYFSYNKSLSPGQQGQPGENNITVVATDGINEVSVTLKAWYLKKTPKLVINAVDDPVRTPSVTISGETDAGIEKVTLIVDSGAPQEYVVDYEGNFEVILNLENKMGHTVEVSVEDVYGNTASDSVSFEVKTQDWFPEEGEEAGLQVEPMQLGLLLAVVGITLIVAAFATAYAMTRRRD